MTFYKLDFTMYLVIESINLRTPKIQKDWMENRMNDKYERQMKKGVLDMLVLKLLESESKHGYRIIQEMKEKSEGIFSLKDGTLYPVLYRLEDDGLVRSHWSEGEEGDVRLEHSQELTQKPLWKNSQKHSQKDPQKVSRKVPRKYYEITEAGRKALGEIQTVWERISGGIERIMEDSS